MTLVWRPGWNGLTEPEAVEYVAAVEAADGQELEFGVAKAINDFVLGCKNDGIWSAIKASCILAGARTLAGALVPLKGTAPTNNNFVSGDYNRETGLKGDGSTKYLNSNRNNNADPQDSKHLAVWRSTAGTGNNGLLGSNGVSTGHSHLYTGYGFFITRNNAATAFDVPLTTAPSATFYGTSRASSAEFSVRVGGIGYATSVNSQTPANASIRVFETFGKTNARLSFYSIGESLDLAALDNRVTTLMTDIGAAIP